MLTAVAAYFAQQQDDLATGATVLTVVGSFSVSYTRARAEALGVECKVGIASRAVRVVILSIGLVFAAGELVPDLDLLEPAIYVMAALTIFTTFQRVIHVRQQLRALQPQVDCNRTGVPGFVPRWSPCEEAVPREICRRPPAMTDSYSSNGASRYQTDKVRVAIIGVGNCASSFVQGVEYYKDADAKEVRPRTHARGPRRLPRP